MEALLSILMNSIEAIAQSTGSEKVIQIHVTHRSSQTSQIEIECRDSGQGFLDPSDVSILEPFVTTKPGHLGLGLTFAQQYIQYHHGKLEFSNSPAEGARGACVKVTLPLHSPRGHSKETSQDNA